MTDVPITKSGQPDKRYKASKAVTTDFPNDFEDITEELQKTVEKKSEKILEGIKFDYEIINASDLDDRVINMGDYLVIIPPNCPPLVKIKVRNV